MATKLKDYFKDVTTYVTSLGFFDKIKISSTSNDFIIEALDTVNKEVILKGKFKNTTSELEGEFGLSNLSLLNTICNDSEFNATETSVKIVYDTQNGLKLPVELDYQNKSKSTINYRFMRKELVPNQPNFSEPTWDVVIKPTKTNIQQFAWVANGLSGYESYFTPKIVDNELRFYIGDDGAATQRGGVVFSSDRTETFAGNHKWKIQNVLNLLKISDSADCQMAFSEKGALQITLNSGIGSYRYIFPAKVK